MIYVDTINTGSMSMFITIKQAKELIKELKYTIGEVKHRDHNQSVSIFDANDRELFDIYIKKK